MKKHKDLLIQIFISITVAIVIISLSLFKTPKILLLTTSAALIGTFILDLDYFFYAYFLEPEKGFSQTLRGFVTHRDINNVISHIQHNKGEVSDKTLNSAFFQILLAGITILAVSSTSGIFLKTLIVSTFANSIYRLTDYYFDGQAKDWFWALKKTPNDSGILLYGVIMFLILSFSISLM
jgi:hypothetical protein